MKRQMFMRRLTALIVSVVLVCGLTACGNTTADPVTHTITVQSEGGMPLEDVRVDVYRAEDLSDRVWAGMTDANGTVTFQAPSATYQATVTEVADGFYPAEFYPITEPNATLAVSMQLIKGDVGNKAFALGDVMFDFSVTQENTYTLSELLQTKKAVVLNFWFEGCGPCRAEFPYLQKAYEKYADQLEVLAINPYDGTADSVAAYAEALGLTFPMIKADDSWSSALKLTSFPTTVVIDRYGMIAFSHKSSITQEGVFETIFAYFTSDDYVQGAVRNISDLTQ